MEKVGGSEIPLFQGRPMRYRTPFISLKRASPFRFQACRGAGPRVVLKSKRLRILRTRFVNILPLSKSSFAAKRFARLTSLSDRVKDSWRQPPRCGARSTKAGFSIVCQGKHIVMSNGTRILTIPRHNPVNAFTLGGIVRDAGLTVEQFRDLL